MEIIKATTPRNQAENIIGIEALIALDNLGIGIYSRDLIKMKQRRMIDMARLLAVLSTHPCPFGKIARRFNQKTLIPLPTAGMTHQNIVCRRLGCNVISKTFIVHKKVPAPGAIRRNRKCAHVRSV